MITLRAGDIMARDACTGYGIEPSILVTLRLIRVSLPGGGTEVLGTSLLDTRQYPASEFGELYSLRWGIETDYRVLKCPLNIENFSGRTPLAVRQDFYAGQLLKNLARLFCLSQQPVIDRQSQASKHHCKANLSQAISTLRDSLTNLCLRPCITLMSQILALIRGSLSVIRPGRTFPRQRRRSATRGCEGYKPVR